MPFISERELENWANPQQLDAILLTKARLAAKLESKTSPLVYLSIGAIGGVLYYMARRQFLAEFEKGIAAPGQAAPKI